MDQRYYSSIMARFLTPDPYKSGSDTGDPANPQSWNRYAYSIGDPVNFHDPHGLLADAADGYCPAEYESCGEWDWLDQGGGDGITFPCKAPPGFTRIPGTFCYLALAAPAAPEKPQPLQTCTIDFEYRGVGIPAGLNFGAGHGYLHVITSTADYVVEGYNDNGLLKGQETDHGLPNDKKGKDRSAGLISGASICNWLPMLDRSIAKVNSDTVTYDKYGPNSNTVLYYVLHQLPGIHDPWYENPAPGLIGFYAYNF
jgi:hypothetical protein